jgi:pimeloyl-ACP methyl ester carboxylesterase
MGVAVEYLQRTDGRVAWTDTGGTGSLIICISGIGDLRATWRFAEPGLVAAGFRVVTMDLRGHGDSSVSFQDFSAKAVGGDIVALLDLLGPAVIIGNSLAGAAGIWAAAERPQAVKALVLVDPFVRDFPLGFGTKLALKLAFLRPWGPATWASFYKSEYPEHHPVDLDAYAAALSDNLREAGRIEAVRAMLWASKQPCEARISEVHVPVLVLMGSKDSDFPEPEAEARAVAARLGGQAKMIWGSGHYPHADQPDLFVTAVVQFLSGSGAKVIAP